MVAHRMTGYAAVMTAAEGRRQADVRGAGLFPEAGFLSPIRLGPGSHRNPDLDPELCRVAARPLGQATQLAEDVERLLVGRIGVRHPAVAPFGDARQGPL